MSVAVFRYGYLKMSLDNSKILEADKIAGTLFKDSRKGKLPENFCEAEVQKCQKMKARKNRNVRKLP